jgi:hypothetical protein
MRDKDGDENKKTYLIIMKIMLTNFITKELCFRNPCKSTAEPAEQKRSENRRSKSTSNKHCRWYIHWVSYKSAATEPLWLFSKINNNQMIIIVIVI